MYSATREAPPPETGWKDRPEGVDLKVNLYSENVLKEGDTTEEVDRESIANLATTKKQWERQFSESTPPAPAIKKKATPKWEVRLPYKEKNSVPPANDVVKSTQQTVTSEHEGGAMPRGAGEMESAIEREIRLAHEREEMLRLEQEQRLKAEQEVNQKPMSSGQTIIASYEAAAEESESCQPAFNELTEADRGPNAWGARSQEVEEVSYHLDWCLAADMPL